jgi:hypothetical protein
LGTPVVFVGDPGTWIRGGSIVLWARGVLQDPDLPEEVRSFLEAVLKSYPDLDIRLLAAARRSEPSAEGREALTNAMRNLL